MVEEDGQWLLEVEGQWVVQVEEGEDGDGCRVSVGEEGLWEEGHWDMKVMFGQGVIVGVK